MPLLEELSADSDEAAPLFDCAPGFPDALAPCFVGYVGDECCHSVVKEQELNTAQGPLQSGTPSRFLPHMRRIRETIANGTIGEVRSITADHRQKLPDDPMHRLNALELGGGALLDLGIYPISFAWDIFGKPQSIKATAAFRATGADVQVATLFHYESGAIATTLSSSDSVGPNRASVVGTKGRIEIDRVWYSPTTFRVYDNEDNVLETFDGSVAARGMQFQAEEAERLITSGLIAGEIMPPSQSVDIMATLDEVRSQIGLRYLGER
ncbi:Gfo/Idh/MocA family protein [Rhizobium leguminosarum]|uniref:Gfo/Idh/MocA family protein n=1 Tax=Rhizobium leguminosarum TaxID=384 RepID=UPI003F99B18A